MLQNGDCWSDQFTAADFSSLGTPVELRIHPETDELLHATFKCATCSGRLAVRQCGRGVYELIEPPECGEIHKSGPDPARTDDLTDWQHTTPPHGTPEIGTEEPISQL